MDNYPTSTEVVRSLSQIKGNKETLFERDGWAVMRFTTVVVSSDIWVVSEKGFLWEPFDDLDSAIAYINAGCPD